MSGIHFCMLIWLCVNLISASPWHTRTDRFLIFEDQLNANTSAPVFLDNTFPKVFQCQINKPCSFSLPVDSKQAETPNVQHGHYDPGLVVEPIKVWNKQPFICDITHARCPYEAIVTVVPTEEKAYHYCIQTTDEDKVNADERCFLIQGTQENTINSSQHFNYPPTLPNNATMSCPINLTCHYTVEFERRGGSCHPPRILPTSGLLINVTETEVKQFACRFDVAYTPLHHAGKTKTLCVAINQATVEKHCVNVHVAFKTPMELAGPCSRIYCENGSFCDSVAGKSRCLCQPGYTGKHCNQPTECSVSFPSSVTCPDTDCSVTGIVTGTSQVTSNGNVVDVLRDANNGRVNIVQIHRTGNSSKICFRVNQTSCHKDGCVTVIPGGKHLPSQKMLGHFSHSSVTYNCSTHADCYLTIPTYPLTNTMCTEVTVQENTTVTNHRVMSTTLNGQQCATTVVVTGTSKGGVNQQLCLKTKYDVKCVDIIVKDFEKCSPDPCKNGGKCDALLLGYKCTCSAGWTGVNCTLNINECIPNPCQSGTCVDEINNYTCMCYHGYTGRHCETDIDECSQSPCKNGTCIDGINNYTCMCQDGYSGRNCETDIDECYHNPCQNGTCIDEINNYTCMCKGGYSGRNCETDINECEPDPCVYGNCSDGINSYTCTCDAGYEDLNCSTDIDECATLPCIFGNCTDGISSYTCTCEAGFSGRHCDINIDECLSSPCQNGGTCLDDVDKFSCLCVQGFTGPNCEKNIDECAMNPCINGTCIDGINDYTCTCIAGFSGRNCDINIDECLSSPCENGGTCWDGVDKYSCHCVQGYTGRNCETDIDECATNPCMNGNCTDGISNYTCTCAAGFSGPNCDMNIDDCLSTPCENGGTCWDGVDTYACQCVQGYTGRNCETDINECQPNPCYNGAVCTDLINSFKCTCKADFSGRFCENRILHCHAGECLNGGTCTNGTCHCKAGYRGEHCQLYINPCSSSPCLRGSCYHHETAFYCDCPTGYTGKLCQTLINNCQSVPCLNGGSCLNSLNNFTCTCPFGFTGEHCQTDIDDCHAMPCLHGGNCVDGVNSFTCQCQYGYGGNICQKVTDCCIEQPCVTGTCFSSATGYHCTCPPGFTGKTCNTSVMALTGPGRVNITIHSGGDILMNCSVAGKVQTFWWSKMNDCRGLQNTPGGSSLQIPGAVKGDSGIYTCIASNGHDPNITKYFHVQVKTNQSDVCNFDKNSTCSWRQMSNGVDDKFDWTPQSGSTQSSGTGPDNDHTTGQGAYMYIESSSPRLQGDDAGLLSQKLPANHTMCLEFWYYMYGDGIGNLTVNLEDNCIHKETEVFRQTGEQGQKWIKASVTIPSNLVPNDYTIKLTGDVGPTFKGDTAIDDISLKDGSCTTSPKSGNVVLVGRDA